MNGTRMDRLLARAAGRLATARPLLPGRFEPAAGVPSFDAGESPGSRSFPGDAPPPAKDPSPSRIGADEPPQRLAPASYRLPPLVREPAAILPRPPGAPSAPQAFERERPKSSPRPRLENEAPAPSLAALPPSPRAAAPIPAARVPAAAGGAQPPGPAPAASSAALQEGPRPPDRPQRPELEPLRSAAARPSQSAEPAASLPLPGVMPARSVEIRIGRIEVLAARPATPAKNTPPKTAGRPAGSLSLDDYLRRRRGG